MILILIVVLILFFSVFKVVKSVNNYKPQPRCWSSVEKELNCKI